MDQCFDVVDRGVIAAGEECPSFGAEDDILTSSSSCTPAHPIVDEAGRARLAWTTGGGEAHSIADDIFGDRHALDDIVEAADVFASEEGFDWCRAAGCGLLDHGHFVVFGQVIDEHVEHEAIELS